MAECGSELWRIVANCNEVWRSLAKCWVVLTYTHAAVLPVAFVQVHWTDRIVASVYTDYTLAFTQ